MAAANRTWGAERIRGELLKLHIRVAKWTIQKYLRSARPPRRSGQSWATFLHNHTQGIWACDFLLVTDLLFRSIHAFFVMDLATRRIVHIGVTRHPTDAWVTQQLREATRSVGTLSTSFATTTAGLVAPSRGSGGCHRYRRRPHRLSRAKG